MKIPLVKVEWGDAWSAAGWGYRKGSCKPYKATSVGYLLERNKEGVLLVERFAIEDGVPSYGNTSFIPQGMIDRIILIKGHAIEVNDRD